MTTGTSPGAGGNLAHLATNDNRYHALLELTDKLGATTGEAEDVRIKHLLAVTQAAFEGVIDNTEVNGVDAATTLTERYWKARNQNVIFNPKAGNQRKTISCVRKCISLGGWTKGGPGEPLGMINRAMSGYQKLRKDPNMSKRLIDAANYLILIARRMTGPNGSNVILADDELHDLAFKKDPDIATVEDVLDGVRSTLKKLYDGKHKAGSCQTQLVQTAITVLTKELKGIADSKRSTAAVTEAEADIIAEADRLQQAEGAASVS